MSVADVKPVDAQASLAGMRDAKCVVLHLDDDVDLNDAVRSLLQAAGCTTITAASSDEAVDHVLRAGARPDVLLMDYRLAEEATGTDVAERIARALGYPIPTIMLTANLANAEVPWMPGSPIMLVAKPADPTMLLETIAHFAALHRAAHARHHVGMPLTR
jgi:two-component system, sensor histidine kinase